MKPKKPESQIIPSSMHLPLPPAASNSVPSYMTTYISDLLDPGCENHAPYMEGLMKGVPKESWAFGEHRDCVYVDFDGSSYLVMHVWSSGHRFFSEEMDKVARKFRKTDNSCMEYRRLATQSQCLENEVACRACRLELDSMWNLCKGIAANALPAVEGDGGAATMMMMRCNATREIIILMKTQGEGNYEAMVYMSVGQDKTPEYSITFIHVERIQPNRVGRESLSSALLGKGAAWDLFPLDDFHEERGQEKMLAFLMCTHARLGEACCQWLKEIDSSLFELSLYDAIKKDSLSFEDVTALLEAAFRHLD